MPLCPPDGICPLCRSQVAVLDYQSTQLRLMPVLATCYGLHFAKGLLIDKYVEMKRTKEPRLVEEVRAQACMACASHNQCAWA